MNGNWPFSASSPFQIKAVAPIPQEASLGREVVGTSVLLLVLLLVVHHAGEDVVVRSAASVVSQQM